MNWTEVGSFLGAMACFGVVLVIWIAPVAWVVGDAQRRGQTGVATLILIWLFGPLSALVWLGVRPRETLVASASQKEYNDPEAALADASRLDHIGEWDAAAALYQNIADRWPEHAAYAQSCLSHLREKQDLHR